jgi:hypothetical protein
VIATKLEKLSGMDVEGAADVPVQLEQLDTEGLSGNRHHMLGTAVHYGIGVGPASIYSVVQHRLPLPGPARGALYGLTLFLAQDEVANALTALVRSRASTRGKITQEGCSRTSDTALPRTP